MEKLICGFLCLLVLAGCNSADKLERMKCGETTCAVGSEFCCSNDFGDTGTCLPVTSSTCRLPELQYYCDGPEDCLSGYDCCIVGGHSDCRPQGSCPAELPSNKPYVVCHDDYDCDFAQPNCTTLSSALSVCQ